MSEYMSDKKPECIPKRMPEDTSDRMSGFMSDTKPEYISERMPEDASDNVRKYVR